MFADSQIENGGTISNALPPAPWTSSATTEPDGYDARTVPASPPFLAPLDVTEDARWRYDDVRPSTSSTIAINGKVPCVNAARALSGDDTSSTTAAAAIDPTPAKMSAAPTALCPMATAAMPMLLTIARNRL